MKSCNLRKQTLNDVKDMIYLRLWEHRRLYSESVCSGDDLKESREAVICIELRHIINMLDEMEKQMDEAN